uniref:Probable RNA-binding protein EIF1AD n=1 Tax=Panagrolaimus sp. JU765 TaxID=591449 RepID=A0AC34RCR5_9BILA
MSKATKKRFIHRQMETEMVLPTEKQIIAKVIGSPGNNLFEILDERGKQFLASMPTKFRKNVWVKRGQFVVVEEIEEGDKVKGEISHVLDAENILYIDEQEKWPECFKEDADKFKRSTRRNLPLGTEAVIDPDMLPPSDEDNSESEDDEAEEAESAEGEIVDSSDDDEELIKTYNPNRRPAV